MTYQIEDTASQSKDICDFKLNLPCAHHLWDVNCEAELLDGVKADLFHQLTSKLLYIKKKTRLDIEPAVALLTTRVSKSNVGDWEILRRYISYLNQTLYDVRIIGGFYIIDFFTWVDASNFVSNMRSQTGEPVECRNVE